MLIGISLTDITLDRAVDESPVKDTQPKSKMQKHQRVLSQLDLHTTTHTHTQFPEIMLPKGYHIA